MNIRDGGMTVDRLMTSRQPQHPEKQTPWSMAFTEVACTFKLAPQHTISLKGSWFQEKSCFYGTQKVH
jgi:hypothetical protein